ncbi:hypothetical protein MUO79_06985 [Candidatus Bathyarchaeota archaeon]|nr:hypothetical protein [Candidatus Bathyarchaeota archaeon]
MAEFKLFLEDFMDLLNAQESSIVKMRMQLEKLLQAAPKGSPRLPFDASKIGWQDRENEKGKFQSSEDTNNPEHKALLAFLNEHVPSKCVQSEGLFYWIYPNGTTIGRKLRK